MLDSLDGVGSLHRHVAHLLGLAVPVRFFPPQWNWGSYPNPLTCPDYDFTRFIFNSARVTVLAVALCIFLSARSGCGFTKFRRVRLPNPRRPLQQARVTA